MNCDLLLYWMTHLREGSWTRFRKAVQELSGTEADSDSSDLQRGLRVRLSDLGLVDFFVSGTQQWKILPPALGGLAESRRSVLWGGRTPDLVESLGSAAARYGCEVIHHSFADRPTQIVVEGRHDLHPKIAAALGLPFADRVSESLAGSLKGIPESIESAETEPAPLNWKVRSFDLDSLTWVEGLHPRSACEYTPTFGAPKYFLHKRRGRLLRMDKHEAVHASAMLRGQSIVAIDGSVQTLSTPLAAPLPAAFSRIACLCSGTAAEVVDGRLAYRHVPSSIADILMIALGQRPGVSTAAAIS